MIFCTFQILKRLHCSLASCWKIWYWYYSIVSDLLSLSFGKFLQFYLISDILKFQHDFCLGVQFSLCLLFCSLRFLSIWIFYLSLILGELSPLFLHLFPPLPLYLFFFFFLGRLAFYTLTFIFSIFKIIFCWENSSSDLPVHEFILQANPFC